MLDITPSAGLIKHEWRKHSTCSSLSPDDYFALARRAYRAISIPEVFVQPGVSLTLSGREIEEAFLAADPDLGAASLSVVCRGG